MDKLVYISATLKDVVLKLDEIKADVARLANSKIPDHFVPLLEATRYLHCGRDWLVAQINGGVLRSGIDYMDRSSLSAERKRYLVNPVSALRWLNKSQPVAVIPK
jgi:hypothetical protein